MNKTLLLIIIDFLFLNLIALTRWEKGATAQPRQAPINEVAANSPPQNPRMAQDQDMVALMRLSLADERKSRAQVTEKLQATEAELASREKSVHQLTSVRAQLESNLATVKQQAEDLNQRYTAAAKEASISQARLAQLQDELARKQAETARQQQQIAALNRQQAESQQRIEGLNVAVKVAEQEKTMLQSNLADAKQQVVVEREERQKVLAQNKQLAAGVGQLAKSSGEIAQEIRRNTPINANVLFRNFLANRVYTRLTASRRWLLGTTVHDKRTETVLVTDGKQDYALMHASDTPFPVLINDTPSDWQRISGQLGRPPESTPVTQIDFLALDPRVVVIPVPKDLATRLGVKVYHLAENPFKFPEAVLVKNGGAGYGEVPFKLDPQTPHYVRMDNRLIKHLMGDFTPSSGDLVFSKTGALIGIMVNSDYCAVIDGFEPFQTIKASENAASEHTAAIMSALDARLGSLPLRLQ